ncbi:MAG: efflux RND transporter periplasmic adaptor subunit [Burkholderiales bacterium]|nr:efflux RND transporter periplasmic adaptor subunit [Burkholderiales bacterium]
MKPWMKWTALAVVVAVIAASAMRVLSARSAQKVELEAQQVTAKAQAVVDLAPSDVVQVKTLDLVQTVALTGALKAVNSAVVKARVPGELQGLNVREGDRVAAGDVIARIDPSEYQSRLRQAQQQAESARAQVDIAKRNFDNNRSLVDQGFISKTALDSSLATLASAEANYRAAQAGTEVAQKALDDTVLRAPISGIVAQRLAQPGERVAVEARIVEVVDLSRLELEATVSAADSLRLRLGQNASLSVEGSAQPVTAKLVRINPSAAAGSRALLIYLTVAPQADLRQGLFAQGTLAVGTLRTLALPLSAVRTDRPEPYVQLLRDGQVQHQSVTPGERGEFKGEAMVAIEGLAVDSPVLQGSVGSLRAGTLVKMAASAK